MTFNNNIEINEILEALNSTRADNYQDWLEVGMALFHAGQSCSVWENWSRQSSKYKDGVCQKKWASFNNSSSSTLNIGSLVQWAKEDGYKFETKEIVYSWNDILEISQNNKNSSVLDFKKYLQAVFKIGDIINFVPASFEKEEKFYPVGTGINKTFDDLLNECNATNDLSNVIGSWQTKAGAWIRFNPMSGEGCKNSDVVEFRHCLIESDSLPKDEQLAKIKELNLPCSAIVDSGGKSIHAIVRIDAGKDEKLYKQRVQDLHKFLEEKGFAVDKACKNASRLSRLAGVSRDGKKQSLIATNIGAKSYDDWQSSLGLLQIEELTFKDLFSTPDNDKSDNLLGNRFLTREGSWLIVAQSGIGKSVLAMQMAISFALGKDLWGLKPIKPLKIALIQAENNKLDLVEPLKSICEFLNLNSSDLLKLNENFRIFPNSSDCGAKFPILLDNICKKFAPDIVIIDPLLSYIGGDISKQEVCSFFLRNALHPIIKKHQMGLVLLHHTPKPRGKEDSSKVLSYAGAGSAELTNYVRAVSTIFENSEASGVYDFTYNKRGKRFAEGLDVAPTQYLRQGTNGQICWIATDKPTPKAKSDNKPTRKSKYDFLELETLEPMTKEEMTNYISQNLEKNDMPNDKETLKKVFSNAKMHKIIFNESEKKWQGKLYF